jgi:hypothetical protein
MSSHICWGIGKKIVMYSENKVKRAQSQQFACLCQQWRKLSCLFGEKLAIFEISIEINEIVASIPVEITTDKTVETEETPHAFKSPLC